MKRTLLVVGCLLASAVSFAQTVNWNPDTWDIVGGRRDAKGAGQLNDVFFAHSWVQKCDMDNKSVNINGLGSEYLFVEWGPEGGYVSDRTGNIGTPLQLILNGSLSVYNDKTKEFCSSSRRKELARRFLRMGANPDDGLYHPVRGSKTKFSKIDTPLGYAARTGNIEVASLLLENNADPNYQWHGTWRKTKNGSSWDNNIHFALKEAVMSQKDSYTLAQRQAMIKLLAGYGADVNATDDCGMTVLAQLIYCDTLSGSQCPVGLNGYDYRKLGKTLRLLGANPAFKRPAEATCKGRLAGMSAKDVLKELKGFAADQWKEVLGAKIKK